MPYTRDPRFLKLITLVMGQKQQLLWDLPPADTYAMNRAIYDIPRAQADETVRDADRAAGDRRPRSASRRGSCRSASA